MIDYLDSEFSAFARGVGDARYALWLGSGISLARVEGVKDILLRALKTLQEYANTTDPNDRYLVALARIITLSGLPAARLASMDYRANLETWPPDDLQELLHGLAQNYSKILDVRIEGEASDFLLWDIIDLRSSYAVGSLEPDCEHLAIAILALEGHTPEIATANWDGLIEGAFSQLGRDQPLNLQICVTGDDLDAPGASARLLKFHGCAIRASNQEVPFRRMLIHQAHQIVNYNNNPDFRAMRTELVSLATKRRSLMIGLSAQDFDIQSIFSDASASHTWDFEKPPPAYVFAEDSLGGDQATILRSVYGESFDDHPHEIESRAIIRAYAKPLLTGLVLHLLCQKLQSLARRCAAPQMTEADIASIAEKILWIRDWAAASVKDDYLLNILEVANTVTTAMYLFRQGKPPSLTAPRYWPLTGTNLLVVEESDEIASGGLPELALSLGLIGEAAAAGEWVVQKSLGPGVFQLKAANSGTQTRVFFASTASAAIALKESGTVDSYDGDVLVIQSDRVASVQARSPRSAPGRTGSPAPRHLGMADLLAETTSPAELRLRFREEAGL